MAERINHFEHAFVAEDVAAKLKKLSSDPTVKANMDYQYVCMSCLLPCDNTSECGVACYRAIIL